MGGVIVEDHVDDLAHRDFRLDRVEKTDELLMPVTLHIAADHRAVENVQGGEQGRRAVPFVVMGHGSSAALFQRQPRLGAVERLNLAFLINRQNDGVRRRIDVKPDDVAQFVDEFRIVRQFELPDPMRLEAMGAPDALDRTDRDASGFGHHHAGPVRGLAGRVRQSQGDDLFGDISAQRLNAGRPRLVAKEAVETFLHEPFLPAPDASLGLARSPHDLARADCVGAEQNDLSPPNMLLGGVSIPDEALKPAAIRSGYCDGYSRAHRADSHRRRRTGILSRTLPSDFVH